MYWKKNSLKNYLHWKNVFIQKLLSLKNYFHCKKYLHWKKQFIEEKKFHWKTAYIQKLFKLKNFLHWKNNFHWKTIVIERTTSIEKLLHIQNVAFKIVFNTWWKLIYEKFPFSLEKNYENDSIIWTI